MTLETTILNNIREKLKVDNRISYGVGVKAEQLLDRVEKRLTSRKVSYEVKKPKAVDQLALDAYSHFDYLLHCYWEVKGLSEFISEPAKGKYNPTAWDAWTQRNETNRLKNAKDRLRKSEYALQNRNKEFMLNLRNKKRSKFLLRAGGGTLPE